MNRMNPHRSTAFHAFSNLSSKCETTMSTSTDTKTSSGGGVSSEVCINDVLAGKSTPRALYNCSTHHLEYLLEKVMDFSINKPLYGTYNQPTNLGLLPSDNDKPKWWPDDVLQFEKLQTVQEQVRQIIISWHAMLAEILASYARFCIEIHDDLLPSLDLLPIGEPSEKRKSVPLLRPVLKRISVGPHSEILRRQPIVLLKDVLKTKYPVLEKEDYMEFLSLQKSTSRPHKDQAQQVVKLKMSSKVPFSSDYGRKILKSSGDRYALNSQLFKRKCDWTNSYLRERDTHVFNDASVQYNVTYNQKKHGCDDMHLYKFPKRQHRRVENRVTELHKAFCRSVKVVVKRGEVETNLQQNPKRIK